MRTAAPEIQKGRLQAWLARRAQLTNEWMARQVDRPEWIAGWWHDYVNPDGSPRQWSPDNRPADTNVTPSGRKMREGWTHMFRARHIEAVRDAALLYRATGEQRYAEWAISQISFYARHYKQWPLQRRLGLSRLMGQNLDEATVIIHLAEAARAVRPLANSADWTQWRNELFIPVADTLKQSVNGLSNISVWQRSAQGVIALLISDLGMWRDAVDGPTGFKSLVLNGITSDGVWYEGSFGYNAYVIKAALPLLQAAKETGNSSELTDTVQRLRLALIAPLGLRFDDGTLPNPSDSTNRLRAPDLSLLAEARTLLPTPWADSASLLFPGWPDVWSPIPPLAAAVPALPQVKSKILNATSMGVIKDINSGWQVFAHWGQRTQHHAQREALNLELHWRGKPVSLDPGTVSYGSPMHSTYYTQPAAHNVPFVDDKGQQGWGPGEVTDFDAAGSRLAVTQSTYTEDVRVNRTISLLGDSFHDAVQFGVRPGASPPKTMGLTWHFNCAIADENGLTHNPSGALSTSEGFQHWIDIRPFKASGAFNISLKCAQGDLTLKVQLAGSYEVFKARAPDLPAGTYRDAIYIRAPFERAGFNSSLSPIGSR
jgi:hypothetical protein